MFVAVGAGYPGVAVLHLVAHGCFKALLFLLRRRRQSTAAGSYALARHAARPRAAVVAAVSAIGALALAGVPPLGAALDQGSDRRGRRQRRAVAGGAA